MPNLFRIVAVMHSLFTLDLIFRWYSIFFYIQNCTEKWNVNEFCIKAWIIRSRIWKSTDFVIIHSFPPLICIKMLTDELIRSWNCMRWLFQINYFLRITRIRIKRSDLKEYLRFNVWSFAQLTWHQNTSPCIEAENSVLINETLIFLVNLISSNIRLVHIFFTLRFHQRLYYFHFIFIEFGSFQFNILKCVEKVSCR